MTATRTGRPPGKGCHIRKTIHRAPARKRSTTSGKQSTGRPPGKGSTSGKQSTGRPPGKGSTSAREAPTRVTISRKRLAALSLITAAAIAAAGIYAALAFQDAKVSQSAPPPVDVTTSKSLLQAAPFVLFRNTAPGQGFGSAATVPLVWPRRSACLERGKLRPRLRHSRPDLMPADQTGAGHQLPGHRVQQHLAGDAQLAAARHPQ